MLAALQTKPRKGDAKKDIATASSCFVSNKYGKYGRLQQIKRNKMHAEPVDCGRFCYLLQPSTAVYRLTRFLWRAHVLSHANAAERKQFLFFVTFIVFEFFLAKFEGKSFFVSSQSIFLFLSFRWLRADFPVSVSGTCLMSETWNLCAHTRTANARISITNRRMRGHT